MDELRECDPGCTIKGRPHSECLLYGLPTTLRPTVARRTPLEGEIRRSTVGFPEIQEGLSVGPEDVLVIAVADHIQPSDLKHVTDHLNRVLGPTRYVIVTGMGTRIAKVHKGIEPEGIMRIAEGSPRQRLEGD